MRSEAVRIQLFSHRSIACLARVNINSGCTGQTVHSAYPRSAQSGCFQFTRNPPGPPSHAAHLAVQHYERLGRNSTTKHLKGKGTCPARPEQLLLSISAIEPHPNEWQSPTAFRWADTDHSGSLEIPLFEEPPLNWRSLTRPNQAGPLPIVEAAPISRKMYTSLPGPDRVWRSGQPESILANAP
jgi:hypothetical protein